MMRKVLACVALFLLAASGSQSHIFKTIQEVGGTGTIDTVSAATSSNVSVTLASDAIRPQANACVAGATPQWSVNVTLTEKAGVATTLTRMVIAYYDNNLVPTGTDIIEGSKLAGFFTGCGSNGFNIPANGRLCGNVCVSLSGLRSGFIKLSFTIQDPNQMPYGTCGSLISLLAFNSSVGADLSVTNVASVYSNLILGFENFAPTGQTYLYTITVNNNGPETARNVILSDLIAAGAAFQTVVTSQGQVSAPLVGTTGPVTCQIGSIPPGLSVNVWLFVKAAFTPSIQTTVNRATVTSSTTDPNPDDNIASETVKVITENAADEHLSVVSTPLVSTTAVGTRMTYTIKVTNLSGAGGGSIAHILPSGTTFASATIDKGSIFGKPSPGGTGLILFSLHSGLPANITVTLNVLGDTGTGSPNLKNNLLFAGETTKKFIPCTIALIAAEPDAQSVDVLQNGFISIIGGGIISLNWGIGTPSSSDPTPAPHGLFSGGNAASSDDEFEKLDALPASARSDVGPAAEACTLIGYKLFIGDNPLLVDPADSNVWKLLPPTVTATSAPRAPDGSYYRLVAVYRCPDGSIVSSQPSEAFGSGLPPKITGTPFRDGKHLMVTGEGFVDGAKIIRNDVTIKTVFFASDSLRGKKEGKNTFPGDRIKVRNPDGKESNVAIFP